MLNIVLVEPEIPQNTGNIARTCAATGSQLHLIRPLGFDISEKAVRRAGLDYWNLVEVFDYENLEDFFRRRPERSGPVAHHHQGAPARYSGRPVTGTTAGCFSARRPPDCLSALRERYPERCVRLPMISEARSLNLANTVAAVTYEALRQQDFPGLAADGPAAWARQKSGQIRAEAPCSPTAFTIHP